MNYVNVVGVQFRRAGKVYDFDAADYSLRIGDAVVVETDRGPSLAEVTRVRYVPFESVKDSSLKRIVRVASDKDVGSQVRMSSEEASSIAGAKVRSLGLDMRVLHAEVQFSGNKIVIYFNAPGRVDFRDLVKELAGALRARVELKQVGARDEAKLIGGLGICGREYCCSSFLREFVPVSIKMAKNQNLALNPTKISGGCGRLLCCLTYEDETYTALRKIMPPRGTRIRTYDDRFGDVLKSDFLNQMLLVEFEDGTQSSVKIKDAEIVERKAGVVEDEWADDIDIAALSSIEDRGEEAPRRESRDERPAQQPGQPGDSKATRDHQQGRDQSRGGGRPEQRGDSRPDQGRRDHRNDRDRGRDQRSGNKGHGRGGDHKRPRQDRGGSGGADGNNGGGNGAN